MRPPHDVYRFGSCELDRAKRRLTRGHQRLDISDRQCAMLECLLLRAGEVVPKDDVVKAGWRNGIASDESLAQIIKLLRRALGRQQDGSRYITTVKKVGFRFNAPVQRGAARAAQEEIDARIAAHARFLDGRAAIETFDLSALPGAQAAFGAILDIAPDYAPAHTGIANVYLLKYDATRADAAPDLESLAQAEHHARQACGLDPDSGDAAATLALVFSRRGCGYEAMGAARQALVIDPANWCHHLRFAEVSWGDDRVRAAHWVRRRRPGLALPHWFAACVFIARQDWDAAMDEIRAGCALQDAQSANGGRFNAVGLHLLYALLLAALGEVDEALEHLMRELAGLDARHVYARECGANTWYAIGALRLRRGLRDSASAAFHEARTLVPTHALAMVGLGAVSAHLHIPASLQEMHTVPAAMVKAAILSCQGKHEDAAGVFLHPLQRADRGSSGWMLPIDPLINVAAHPEAWATTLAALRDRAW